MLDAHSISRLVSEIENRMVNDDGCPEKRTAREQILTLPAFIEDAKPKDRVRILALIHLHCVVN